MACVVTGARGLLGRHLIADLIQQGVRDIHAVVRGTPSHPGEVQCDLTDRQAVSAMISALEPAMIYHLAGSFTNRFEIDYPNNAVAAWNLLDAIAERRWPTRTVVIGSAAEYGVIADDANPVPETAPTSPVSVYGLTKLLQTEISLWFSRSCRLNVIVARVFNLLGNGASDQLFVGRVERQIQEIAAGTRRRLEVGDLGAIRDYLPAADAARALVQVMERGISGEIYNIGSGVPISMDALLDTMLAAAQVRRPPVDHRDGSAAARPNVPVIYADVRKLQALAPDNGAPSRNHG